MKIFNSASRKIEEFLPLENNKVSIYLCGPTVYSVPHIGNFRNQVFFDFVRKYLLYKGMEVNFVSNITDIDDKMINRAKEEGITVKELADRITPVFMDLREKLKIMPPTVQPKATEHVPQIIEIIKLLEKKDAIYTTNDGVYYDTSKFPNYGNLSGQVLEDLQMGARVDVNEDKKNPYDFVLWKFKKEGEPAWESPWGEGRPGWHIECSAMTWAHLGEKFDIHAGGMDLFFPHHECEAAQSKLAFGEDSFAKLWMHNGFINFGDEKMSKSLGNVVRMNELLEKWNPLIVRYLLLAVHYRSPVNFEEKILEQSREALNRIHEFVRIMRTVERSAENALDESVEIRELVLKSKEKFESSMENDFDSSAALASVFELIKDVYKLKETSKMTQADVREIIKYLKNIDKVFCFILDNDEYLLDGNIEALIEQREFARKNKSFALADQIRDDLLKKGIILEDSKDGVVWKRK